MSDFLGASHPPAPPVPVDTGTTVDIAVTPTNSGDYNNSQTRIATIRLVPLEPVSGLQLLSLLLGAGLRFLSTYLPFVSHRMEFRGSSILTTRQHHRRRMGVAIRPRSGSRSKATATAW